MSVEIWSMGFQEKKKKITENPKTEAKSCLEKESCGHIQDYSRNEKQ